MSLYGYVGNNPVNLTDPLGLSPSISGCLVKCASDQLGVTDILALGATVSGLPLVPKSFVTPGTAGGTSINSVLFGNKGTMPFNPITGNHQWWAPTWKRWFSVTARTGRFFGRWIPIAGEVVLIYDAVKIGQCVNKCLNDDKCK